MDILIGILRWIRGKEAFSLGNITMIMWVLGVGLSWGEWWWRRGALLLLFWENPPPSRSTLPTSFKSKVTSVLLTKGSFTLHFPPTTFGQKQTLIAMAENVLDVGPSSAKRAKLTAPAPDAPGKSPAGLIPNLQKTPIHSYEALSHTYSCAMCYAAVKWAQKQFSQLHCSFKAPKNEVCVIIV